MADARDKPELITDAELSPQQQLRIRQVRYGVMMGVRALLLIVATVLVMVEVPLLWLWLIFCAAGMVILPWTAVLVANDRLPKESHRLRRRLPFRKKRRPQQPALTARESRIVDVDS
ncbi:MAG: DUF3099 domain-containing protein [Stackebrandtia sp.]